MSVYAVHTTAGQEATVAEKIANRDFEGIHAALAPEAMTAYVMVEADDASLLERLENDFPHIKKIIEGETSMAEVEDFLEPSSDVEDVSEGDLVEITDGPYQGDKAKVKRIDPNEESVTVELTEATVPIPVTMQGNQVRVLDRE